MADIDDLKAAFEQFAGAFNARNLDTWVALWRTEVTSLSTVHAVPGGRKSRTPADSLEKSILPGI
jgi:hypothetical protein